MQPIHAIPSPLVSGGGTLWGEVTRIHLHDDLPIVVMASGADPSGSHNSTTAIFATTFGRVGLSSFRFDFAGLGRSSDIAGGLTIRGAVENMHAAVAHVRKFSWVDPSRVGIFGASFGGMVAMHCAAEDQDISALALKSPASVYSEVLERIADASGSRRGAGGDGPDGPFGDALYQESLRCDTYAAAAKVMCAVLVCHGTSDDIVPVEQSRQLVRHLPRGRLIEMSNVGHFYPTAAKLECASNFADWLATLL